ncbi:MAG: hypothetical protein GF331_04355 [Chitinivibrionales bacterium]|nr:hypothetical protein [Chitinivibrionales bacterium]
MNEELLANALRLASEHGDIVLASANTRGRPHMMAGGRLWTEEPPDESSNTVVLTAWFCPVTMENLSVNPHVAILVRDPITDEGVQLIGDVGAAQALDMTDGLAPGEETLVSATQVEWRVEVHVRRALRFTRVMHQDLEA